MITICINFVCLCERDANNMYKFCMSVREREREREREKERERERS